MYKRHGRSYDVSLWHSIAERQRRFARNFFRSKIGCAEVIQDFERSQLIWRAKNRIMHNEEESKIKLVTQFSKNSLHVITAAEAASCPKGKLFLEFITDCVTHWEIIPCFRCGNARLSGQLHPFLSTAWLYFCTSSNNNKLVICYNTLKVLHSKHAKSMRLSIV